MSNIKTLNGHNLVDTAATAKLNSITETVGGNTLTWDGDTTGLVAADIGEGAFFYHVSDTIISSDDLMNGGTVTQFFEGQNFTESFDLSHEGVTVLDDGSVSVLGVVVSVTEDNHTGFGVSIPKRGTYFMRISDSDIYTKSITIPGYTGFTKEIIKQDALPEALQFGDKETVILEEQELTVDPEQGTMIATSSVPIAAGDILNVVYDGATYKCEVFDINGNIAFGNTALAGMGNNTGEPFIGMYTDEMIALMPSDGETASHTVKISVVTATKIQERYYSAQKVFYIKQNTTDLYLYSDTGYTTKASAAEVLNEIKHRPIVMSIGGLMYLYPDRIQIINTDGSLSSGLVIHIISGGGAEAAYYTAEYTPTT